MEDEVLNDVVVDLVPPLQQIESMVMSGNGSSIDCDSIHRHFGVEDPGEMSATLVMLSEQLN